MSVEQKDTIDVIGVDKETNKVILTISDHLEWPADNHLYLLQEKLNTYLGFIESGEIITSYPDAKDRNIVIKVLALYEPDREGKVFLETVKKVIEGAGIDFLFQRLG